MSRKEITRVLTEAVTYFYARKMYAVFHEFGVGYRGQRRLDVLCLNTKMNLIGVEIKSGRADYTSDSKWREYLPYVNKMYIAVPPKLVESKFFQQILNDVKPHGVGIISLSPAGNIKVIKAARSREVGDKVMMKLLIKMAWRGGISRRTVKETKRRKRFHIEG